MYIPFTLIYIKSLYIVFHFKRDLDHLLVYSSTKRRSPWATNSDVIYRSVVKNIVNYLQ